MKRRALIEKNPNERNFECYLILGKKAQGKSTIMRDLIDDYLKIYKKGWAQYPVKPKVFVHALSDSGAFSGIPTLTKVQEAFGLESPLDVLKKCNKHGTNAVWKKTNALKSICRTKEEIKGVHQTISKHFKYGFALFDEWTVYAKPNPSDWAVDLAFNHRNYKLDVLFACHKLIKVPKAMSDGDSFSRIILFKTGEFNPSDYEFERFSCAPLLKKAFFIVRDSPEIYKVVQYHCIVDTINNKIMEWNYNKGIYQELKGKPMYQRSTLK